MKSLKNFINESKNRKDKMTVEDWLKWYFDIESLEDLTENMLEDSDVFYDMTKETSDDGDGPFKDYMDLIKFFQKHPDEKIEVIQKDLGNVIEHSFKIGDFEFTTDSTCWYREQE